MVLDINFFNSIEYLEPRCEKCGSKIEYGLTTEFSEKLNAHICLKCGNVLK